MHRVLVALILATLAWSPSAVAHGGEVCFQRHFPFSTSSKTPRMHYGRGRPIDVKHIHLELRVDVVGESIAGTATHTLAPVAEPLSSIKFDAVGLTIESVQLDDGRALPFDASADTLTMQLPEPAAPGVDFTLQIRYRVERPEKGIHFRTERMGYSAGDTQAWTQGEAEDARYWFPCFDAPHERTTTEITATVDDPFMAVSNGELLSKSKGTDPNTTAYHWRLDKPHTTYLVSLAVGHFIEIDDTRGGVPIYYYVLKHQEADARLSLGRTPDMMTFFNERLGYPYPWGRYSQVAVVDFIAGGMENTAITTLTERTIHDAAAHLTQSSDPLVAHELAHQWFGDLLTCRDWGNIWLNEAFATFLDAAWAEHDKGPDEYAHRMWDNANDAFNVDPPGNRFATMRQHYAEPDSLFTARIYEKGAWILHMLRRELGEELFWRAVREYLQRFAFQSVETNDLLRVFEDVSGRGLERFFDQWVYKPGYPEFKVAHTWDGDKKVIKIHVEQIQKTDDGTPIFAVKTHMRFGVGETYRDEPIEITGKEHTFYFALPEKPAYLRFDPEASVLKKLTFDRTKAELLAQLAHDKTLAGRYEACQALGKFKEKETADALRKALNEDPYWGVRARAIEALADMDHDAAREALLDGVSQSEARVRQATARALGGQRTDAARAALLSLAQDDPSPYVVAAAINSLATHRATEALSVLRAALDRTSHNEVIRAAALRALAALDGATSATLIAKQAQPDAPRASRRIAVEALGVAGQFATDKAPVRRALEPMLLDANRSIRREAASALSTLGDPQAIPGLESARAAAKENSEREALDRAIRALRDRNTAPEALGGLQNQLDALKKENESLKKRLDTLEEAKKAAEKAEGK